MKHVEIEIKFEIPPHLAASFSQWVTPQAIEVRPPVHLQNRYFDTPEQHLKKLGAGLRIRVQNETQFEQTLKWNTVKPCGSLRYHDELNRPIRQQMPDLSLFEREELPKEIQQQLAQTSDMQEYFTTDFQREYWLVPHAQSEIAITLDQGTITSAHQQNAAHPLCEIELELKSGSPEDLLDFARRLPTLGPMRLGYHTKAAWGERVYQGFPEYVVNRLTCVDLSESTTIEQAIKTILSSGLEHSRYHEQCYMEQPSLAALVQIRNGFALIHQALLIFSAEIIDAAPPPWMETLVQMEQSLSWLNLACARERWCQEEGYQQQSWKHIQHIQDLLADLQQHQPTQETLQAWMHTARYLDLQLTLSQWLCQYNQTALDVTQPLAAFAAETLETSRNKLHQMTWDTSKPSTTDMLKITGTLRHHLMVNLCLGDCFPVQKQRDAYHQSWLDFLQGLEDLAWLETLEQTLIESTCPPDVRQDLATWLQQRQMALINALQASYAHALEQPPYWSS